MIPTGAVKRAAVPVPSAVPEVPPDPANVVTTWAAVILRIVWLPDSTTYKMEVAGSMVISLGLPQKRMGGFVGSAASDSYMS